MAIKKRTSAASILKQSEERETSFKPQALSAEEARAIAAQTIPSPTPSSNEQVSVKRGRPVVVRTISDKGGKQITFEDTDADALWCSSGRGNFSQKDIIRTAVHEFLSSYYDGSRLNEAGTTLVNDYIERTTIH